MRRLRSSARTSLHRKHEHLPGSESKKNKRKRGSRGLPLQWSRQTKDVPDGSSGEKNVKQRKNEKENTKDASSGKSEVESIVEMPVETKGDSDGILNALNHKTEGTKDTLDTCGARDSRETTESDNSKSEDSDISEGSARNASQQQCDMDKKEQVLMNDCSTQEDRKSEKCLVHEKEKKNQSNDSLEQFESIEVPPAFQNEMACNSPCLKHTIVIKRGNIALKNEEGTIAQGEMIDLSSRCNIPDEVFFSPTISGLTLGITETMCSNTEHESLETENLKPTKTNKESSEEYMHFLLRENIELSLERNELWTDCRQLKMSLSRGVSHLRVLDRAVAEAERTLTA